MEELKNENVTEPFVAEEAVVEQRPSTKYGRTAYQQQLQEEQAAQRQASGYEQPYQQYQQYHAYTQYEEVKPEIKPVYAYVLMAVVALTQLISLAINTFVSKAYTMGETIEEIVDATLLIAQEPEMLVLSAISDILFWITVAFFVLDVIQLHKADKKIGGAIAFAILLRPAYFIWRAHLLGQKKLVSVIYAVAVYMISFAQYFVLFSAAMDMVMRSMY